jgi:hypothetical protein
MAGALSPARHRNQTGPRALAVHRTPKAEGKPDTILHKGFVCLLRTGNHPQSGLDFYRSV